MKKRVLQFIGSFQQGGSELQAVQLTRLLRNDGSFEVFAATLNGQGVLCEKIDDIGLPEIPEFPLTSFYDANFVRQVRQCANYFRNNRIDLVHAHDFYTNVFGMAAAALAGIQVSVASKRETGGMRSKSQTFVETIAFRRASAIVANSAAVRDHLKRLGVSDEKIYVIYNGIDIKSFGTPDRDRAAICKDFGLPSGNDVRFVTLIANLRHDVKNVPMLLCVAKRLRENRSNVHFVIAGEGELEAQLTDEARFSEVDERVHFIGRCDDIPALLSVSYACVLTSTAEGFSNSILEYMAAGKPVVATNVGGAAEAIIDGMTGFLVASDDDEAMAARLTELLEDKDKAIRFGAEANAVAGEKFSQESQLRKTVELYDSLLK